MSTRTQETMRQLLQRTLNQTPEAWHAYYRQLFPDITPQETAELYPLFIKAMTAGTSAEQRKAFAEYRKLLAPIKKRNPQPRGSEQELILWT